MSDNSISLIPSKANRSNQFLLDIIETEGCCSYVRNQTCHIVHNQSFLLTLHFLVREITPREKRVETSWSFIKSDYEFTDFQQIRSQGSIKVMCPVAKAPRFKGYLFKVESLAQL